MGWYMASRNEIDFSAGVLRPPVLFDPQIPAYLSYESLGSVAGHEISHGFDPLGSQYDFDCRLRDWWPSSTRTAFDAKSKCFIDQYNNYSEPKPMRNITQWLAHAWREHGRCWRSSYCVFHMEPARESNQGVLLPGLEHFTREQMFFVAYGRFWCSKASGAELYRRMQSIAHAPEQVRLMATMENSAEFEYAFQCPQRRPVCKLW